jgi:hypothetical protein
VADPVFGIIQLQAKPNIKHPFVSGIADGGDASLVQPSNWNAAHNAPPFVLMQIGGGGAGLLWPSQPAGLTEFLGDTLGVNRTKADMTHVLQVRLVAVVLVAGGATPAKLRAQYSTDDSTYAYIDGATGPTVDINSTGRIASAWVTPTALALADVYLRIVGIDG